MTVKALVPVSGGKDSQACIQFALLCFPAENVRGLFCDTQFEHPETYRHIEKLRSMYGVKIDVVTGGTVIEKVEKYKRFPDFGTRFCTDELKIRETKFYCKALAQEQGGFEVWYGMRSDESNARKVRYEDKAIGEVYFPHEVMPGKYPKYLAKMGVSFRLPILDWSTRDVLDFLDGRENPLYAQGFDRVGCFPCLASGDKHKEKAFAHDDFGRGQFATVIEVSKRIGKNVFTSKGGQARNAGCMVCSI